MLSSGIAAVALAGGDVVVSRRDVRVSFHVSRHDSLQDSLSVEDPRGFCDDDCGWPMEVIVGV